MFAVLFVEVNFKDSGLLDPTAFLGFGLRGGHSLYFLLVGDHLLDGLLNFLEGRYLIEGQFRELRFGTPKPAVLEDEETFVVLMEVLNVRQCHDVFIDFLQLRHELVLLLHLE
jgi:hypothetical protein